MSDYTKSRVIKTEFEFERLPNKIDTSAEPTRILIYLLN